MQQRHRIPTCLLLLRKRSCAIAALQQMSNSPTIHCNGCGRKIAIRDSYAVDDQRACSAECLKRILLRDFNQATDRLSDYGANRTRNEHIGSRSSRRLANHGGDQTTHGVPKTET